MPFQCMEPIALTVTIVKSLFQCLQRFATTLNQIDRNPRPRDLSQLRFPRNLVNQISCETPLLLAVANKKSGDPQRVTASDGHDKMAG